MRLVTARHFAALGIVVALAVLGGCTQKFGALPVLVSVNETGWATISIPVCQGSSLDSIDALVYVSGKPENAVQTDESRFAAAGGGHPEDVVYTATVNPGTVRTANLIPGLPIVHGISDPQGAAFDTTGALVVIEVGLRSSSIVLTDYSGPGVWIVRDDGYHGNPVDRERTNTASGLAEIHRYCSDIRAPAS